MSHHTTYTGLPLSKQDNARVYRRVIRNGRDERVRLFDGTIVDVRIRRSGGITRVHVAPVLELGDDQ